MAKFHRRSKGSTGDLCRSQVWQCQLCPRKGISKNMWGWGYLGNCIRNSKFGYGCSKTGNGGGGINRGRLSGWRLCQRKGHTRIAKTRVDKQKKKKKKVMQLLIHKAWSRANFLFWPYPRSTVLSLVLLTQSKMLSADTRGTPETNGAAWYHHTSPDLTASALRQALPNSEASAVLQAIIVHLKKCNTQPLQPLFKANWTPIIPSELKVRTNTHEPMWIKAG